jgi:hypothetical protein
MSGNKPDMTAESSPIAGGFFVFTNFGLLCQASDLTFFFAAAN